MLRGSTQNYKSKNKESVEQFVYLPEALVSPSTNKHTLHTEYGNAQKDKSPYKVMKSVAYPCTC